MLLDPAPLRARGYADEELKAEAIKMIRRRGGSGGARLSLATTLRPEEFDRRGPAHRPDDAIPGRTGVDTRSGGDSRILMPSLTRPAPKAKPRLAARSSTLKEFGSPDRRPRCGTAGPVTGDARRAGRESGKITSTSTTWTCCATPSSIARTDSVTRSSRIQEEPSRCSRTCFATSR